MHKRYIDPRIEQIWSTENKLREWQNVEIAVVEARVLLEMVDPKVLFGIRRSLEMNPIDIAWWEDRDKVVGHDLNAFLEERLRFIPKELHPYFHHEMTSYDTEEPAFAGMLIDSSQVIKEHADGLLKILESTALKYRHTPMMGKTHGQDAELQTFGKRCLQWYTDLKISMDALDESTKKLEFSKISGAIGNYTQIRPDVERKALELLGLKPLYGVTQIVPREVYVPFASALCQMVFTIQKIALAIRLGARSGIPLYHEPFGKKQKGSSAMPHKKNTIVTEQIEGMSRMALGYLNAAMMNVATWEERAIEQSSVERVAWADLLHVTARSLNQMNRVITGLVVYPENMMKEIINTRGTFASARVKEFLRHRIVDYGLESEDAYRIVQLASFNVFEGQNKVMGALSSIAQAEMSYEAMQTLQLSGGRRDPYPESIQVAIRYSRLKPHESLDTPPEKIREWNDVLMRIFSRSDEEQEWDSLFKISRHLDGEKFLFHTVFGV